MNSWHTWHNIQYVKVQNATIIQVQYLRYRSYHFTKDQNEWISVLFFIDESCKYGYVTKCHKPTARCQLHTVIVLSEVVKKSKERIQRNLFHGPSKTQWITSTIYDVLPSKFVACMRHYCGSCGLGFDCVLKSSVAAVARRFAIPNNCFANSSGLWLWKPSWPLLSTSPGFEDIGWASSGETSTSTGFEDTGCVFSAATFAGAGASPTSPGFEDIGCDFSAATFAGAGASPTSPGFEDIGCDFSQGLSAATPANVAALERAGASGLVFALAELIVSIRFWITSAFRIGITNTPFRLGTTGPTGTGAEVVFGVVASSCIFMFAIAWWAESVCT